MRLSKPVLVAGVGLVALTLLVGFFTVGSAASGTVRWRHIRGLSSSVGLTTSNTVVLNTIGLGTGVTYPGQFPWSTTSGDASVNLETGRLDFEVSGLVLGGAAPTGTALPFTSVIGRLVCDTDGPGNSTVVDTPPVPLTPQGDAEFHGEVGPFPLACSEPDIAFLLVNSATGRWIAYGAVRTP